MTGAEHYFVQLGFASEQLYKLYLKLNYSPKPLHLSVPVQGSAFHQAVVGFAFIITAKLLFLVVAAEVLPELLLYSRSVISISAAPEDS